MSKYYQMNQNIRAKTLRVITKDGENLGVLQTSEALKKAQELELDLVVIAEGTEPPIAKILDYNKFLYEENKKASAAKAKSKKSEVKEFKFGPNIGDGDLAIRIQRAEGFLKDGNRVRITVQLRGREKAFPEIGYEKIVKMTKALEGVAKTESAPKQMGGDIRVTFIRK